MTPERRAHLRHLQEQAAAILDNTADAALVMDADGRLIDADDAAETMFARPKQQILGLSIFDLVSPLRADGPAPSAPASFSAAFTLNTRTEMTGIKPSGDEFPIEIAIVASDDAADPFLLGIVRDITARKLSVQRRDLLLQEMAHRGKNLLTVVQAIVNRTFKDDQTGALDVVNRRIGALARSHAVLAANPRGADLTNIVRDEVEAFSDRVQATGPALKLGALAAQTIGLTLHELATNAIKHGALSVESGSIEIEWRVEDDGTFQLRWEERGGPAVTKPKRSGFGRTMLEKVAAEDLKASVGLTFSPPGVCYRIEAPLDAVIAQD